MRKLGGISETVRGADIGALSVSSTRYSHGGSMVMQISPRKGATAADFSIVDTQEHVSAEIRRQPQPENGCLNWRSLAADLGIFLLLEHFDRPGFRPVFAIVTRVDGSSRSV